MPSESCRDVWRLEFRQPPGWRIQWLGPYTSQWLTEEAEEIVRYMEAEHRVTRPHPSDPTIFLSYPGEDRLACGCGSREGLEQWFGDYFRQLQEQGAHVARYLVPLSAVVEDFAEQILFVHRKATVVERWGHGAPGHLIRSSAGARSAIISGSNGKYDFQAPLA